MSTPLLLRSFAGGEITPELAGRLDLVKFQTGLALARNMLILPHGPATRRPGTEFVNEVRDSTSRSRLIPFSFSATQTAVLEFANLRIRFFVNGGSVLETGLAITAITQASPGVISYTGTDPANGDWVFLAGIGGMTQLNGRFVVVTSVNTGANHFEIRDQAGNDIDTTDYGAYTSGGTASLVYEVVTPYLGADVFDLHFAQDSDVITITHPDYPAKQLARLGATNWTLTDVSFAPTLAAPTLPVAVATVAVATNLTIQDYVVTAVGADGVTESLASVSATCNNNLTLAGNFNIVSWAAVVGATRYNVYKKKGSYGYIGQATLTNLQDDNILPDLTQSPPESIITLNNGAGDYPTAVSYHEQRRWFGGTYNSPQVITCTRTGTTSNLTSSIPSRDADAMSIRVAAMQNNAILHMVPLSDLIVFTAGGEFRLFSDGAPAITPTTISIKAQGYSGASNVQPVMTTQSVMYVQAQGSRIRELSYNSTLDNNTTYKTTDVSLMAPHRFNGKSIVQLAYARAPEAMLWAVRNDGLLLGLTHVPDQQVYGWHAHDTGDGDRFESACVVAEGNEDVLYVVVAREIDGRSVRYIERLRTRFFDSLEECFFVDSGLTYNGAPTNAVGGLWHLEGMTVDILADGAVESQQEVLNGRIVLDNDVTASIISIGLPITADIKTLPLSIESAAASGQGIVKNVNKVNIRVANSSLVKAGPSFDKLTAYPPRVVDDHYGSPPALRNGMLSFTIGPTWGQDGAVCIRQDAPVPLTVLSMVLETAHGGG